jgi:aspartate kinase
MIICKFGGTSVGDAAAIRRLVAIVATRLRERPIVVVSALAGVTDGLLAVPDRGGLEGLVARHREVATALGLSGDAIATIEDDAAELAGWLGRRSVARPLAPRERDALVAHGELWSSGLVDQALRRADVPAVRVDARSIIVTDDGDPGRPDLDAISRRAGGRLAPLVARGLVPVTQGFLGATPAGETTTLGRGGSDYTASLLGAALGARRVEIWTDVDGILTADPRIVPDARLLRTSSYQEAARLARAGAKVLHPETVVPLVDARIPCWVGNSFRPDGEGTLIEAESAATAGGRVRSIAVAPRGGKATIALVGAGAELIGSVRSLVDSFAAEVLEPGEHGVLIVRAAEEEAPAIVRVLHEALVAAVADHSPRTRARSNERSVSHSVGRL